MSWHGILIRNPGAYDRATGADPFKLPDSWLKAKPSLALKTHFDFVTDNDIIGGNSGSPVINREGHAVGLIFDGNIHSLSVCAMTGSSLPAFVSSSKEYRR